MALTQVQPGMLGTPQPYSFKNRIINGAMVIDQRNAGASVTPTDAQYTLDRWQASLSQNTKYTVQQSSDAPAGFVNSLKVTSSSAYSVLSGDYFGIQQNIEGYNIADLNFGTANSKTITFSFWVKSSLTGTFGGSLRNAAANRSYPFTYVISSANTWEQKSVTVVGDTTGTWLTTNGLGVSLIFNLGTGTTYSGTAGSWAATNYVSATGATSVVGTNGATFYITGVQLEVGVSATGFDYRPYGTELALCQRYFAAISPADLVGYSINTTTPVFTIYLPVPFRTRPTGITVTAANYVIFNGSNSSTTPSSIVFDDSELTMVGIAATTTGLAAGQGCRIVSAGGDTNFIQINGGEL